MIGYILRNTLSDYGFVSRGVCRCDEDMFLKEITEITKNVVLYVEGIPPITKQKLTEVCKELVDLIKTFCKGEAGYYILNKKESSVEF